jgi:hypothetical protein
VCNYILCPSGFELKFFCKFLSVHGDDCGAVHCRQPHIQLNPVRLSAFSNGLTLANYRYEQEMAAMNDSAQYAKSVLQCPLYIHGSPLQSIRGDEKVIVNKCT